MDGRLVGTVQGKTGQSFTLGQLAPTSRIGFEAENVTDGWSWNVTLTNQTARAKTTLFSEEQSGYDEDRIGLVRHVVMTATGAPIESCGEAIAPVTCIPVDKDGDGTPATADCDDGNSAVHPGATEVINNDVDENCDGIVARFDRWDSSLTFHRRAARYSGRLGSAGKECIAGRRVVLRRVGSGLRAFGAAYTRRDGTFTVLRHRRLHGLIYAVAASTRSSTALCRSGRSGAISG